MPFLYDVCNVKLQLCAKGFSWSRVGGAHLKKLFQFPVRLITETMYSQQKINWYFFFLEGNILGINEGLFKLFNSLTKKYF